MLDSLRGLYVFAHVAELLSFSRASERLGVTKSAVSKHVAQLEEQLGVQLVVRTTRKLVLTDAGERVFASCSRMVGDAEAARDAAHTEGAIVAGNLRVTAPSALARNYLMPLVAEFLALHSQLSIELVIGDHFVDLVEERIDVALRVGGRSEQSLVSRRVARVERFLVASPSYLEKHGVPRTPHDLVKHESVMHVPSGSAPRVTLHRGRKKVTLALHGRLSCNDALANLVAARAGHGFVAVPDFEVADDLRAGTLVRMLPGWRVDELALHLVFPPRRHVLGRVRAFADFVAARFSDPPWRCDRAALQA